MPATKPKSRDILFSVRTFASSADEAKRGAGVKSALREIFLLLFGLLSRWAFP